MTEYLPPLTLVLEIESKDKVICASAVLGTEEFSRNEDGEW